LDVWDVLKPIVHGLAARGRCDSVGFDRDCERWGFAIGLWLQPVSLRRWSSEMVGQCCWVIARSNGRGAYTVGAVAGEDTGYITTRADKPMVGMEPKTYSPSSPVRLTHAPFSPQKIGRIDPMARI
jgi:hypothetical protein